MPIINFSSRQEKADPIDKAQVACNNSNSYLVQSKELVAIKCSKVQLKKLYTRDKPK